MARKPRDQQKTDAQRAGRSSTGKLDAPGKPPARGEPRGRAPAPDDPRARLTRERDAAVARLHALRVSPDFAESASPGGNESNFEEGDAAQASAQRDMSFTTRERLATRINELTAALERIERGEYGRCAVCGGDIEPQRLAALPEASTCLPCQERLERTRSPERAA